MTYSPACLFYDKRTTTPDLSTGAAAVAFLTSRMPISRLVYLRVPNINYTLATNKIALDDGSSVVTEIPSKTGNRWTFIIPANGAVIFNDPAAWTNAFTINMTTVSPGTAQAFLCYTL